MTNDTALLEKREELKRQLTAGEHNPQLWKWVDKTGQLIQKLTRKPEPASYWFSAALLAIILILITSILSLLLGEFQTPKRELIPLELTTVGLILLVLGLHQISFTIIFTAMHDHLLDSVESVTDLVKIQNWLVVASSRRVFFFGLFFSIFITPIFNYFVLVPMIGFISFGLTILQIIVGIVAGMALYYIFVIWRWLSQLDQYHLKLYSANPSKSEIIARLSDLLRKFLYTWALFGIGFALSFTFVNLTAWFVIILQLITVWFPTISTFVIGQYKLLNCAPRTGHEISNA